MEPLNHRRVYGPHRRQTPLERYGIGPHRPQLVAERIGLAALLRLLDRSIGPQQLIQRGLRALDRR